MQIQINRFYQVNNNQGFVLVMGLMFMVVLSIMAAAAMVGRNTEQQIASNSEISDHNFYVAEAVAIEGLVTVHHAADNDLLNPGTPPFLWLQLATASAPLDQSSNWPNGPMVPKRTSLDGGFTDITPVGYNDTGSATGDRIWFAGLDMSCSGGGGGAGGGGAGGGDGTFSPHSIVESTGGVQPISKCYEMFGMYDVKSGAGKAYHGKRLISIGYNKTIFEPQ